MSKFNETMFYRLGAIKFSESFDNLTKLTDVCTYDATMYTTNDPKYCMIRRQETTFRPHLVRHLNLIEDNMRDYIQQMWNRSNEYIQSLNATPYQCFLVITCNNASVAKHTHGNHMGDTITVVSTMGDSITDTYLNLGDTTLKYPEPNQGYKAVCFENDLLHSTTSNDDNYYFHFVYDLAHTIDIPKNTWISL